jgi:predicted enzyme related to lactoylglutathione lyase
MTTSSVGRFVWHELHTGDRPLALKFYATLLGWDTKEVSMGPGEPYGLCFLGGKDIAGITKSMAPAGVPPHWLPYIAVDDVDAAAGRAQELGGRVVGAPMDIPDVGRFAVLSDPQGAAFAIHKHATPYPEEPATPRISGFCWAELASTDPQAAATFYAGLFGYAVESMDMGPGGTYRILKSGDRQRAGIMKAQPGSAPGSHWLEYVLVSDVDASTRNARELGAKTLLEPRDIPSIGRFSIIADPTGATVALFKGA